MIHRDLKPSNVAAAAADQRRFQEMAPHNAWDLYLPGHTAGWRGDLDQAMQAYEAHSASIPRTSMPCSSWR